MATYIKASNTKAYKHLTDAGYTLKKDVKQYWDCCPYCDDHPYAEADVYYVQRNRVSLSLTKADTLYVAQLVGGRLPSGSTKLPDGFSFKFAKVTIK